VGQKSASCGPSRRSPGHFPGCFPYPGPASIKRSGEPASCDEVSRRLYRSDRGATDLADRAGTPRAARRDARRSPRRAALARRGPSCLGGSCWRWPTAWRPGPAGGSCRWGGPGATRSAPRSASWNGAGRRPARRAGSTPGRTGRGCGMATTAGDRERRGIIRRWTLQPILLRDGPPLARQSLPLPNLQCRVRRGCPARHSAADGWAARQRRGNSARACLPPRDQRGGGLVEGGVEVAVGRAGEVRIDGWLRRSIETIGRGLRWLRAQA